MEPTHKKGVPEFERKPDDGKASPSNKSKKFGGSNIAMNILSCIDLFGVEERPENALGGIITLSVTFIGVAYAIVLLLQTLDVELQVANDMKWTPHNEYPISLKCLSSSGCLVSNHRWEDLSSLACLKLDQYEEYDTQISYFDNPKYGLSIISNENGNSYNYTEIVAIKSETYMPWMDEADSDGTYIMWSGVIAGTNYLNMVETSNKTLKRSGRRRREYFGLQVDFNGDIFQDSSIACTQQTTSSSSSSTDVSFLEASNWTEVSDLKQVRLRLQASYNHIIVSNPSSLLTWFGTSSGMYAAMFGYGALFLLFFENWLGKDHICTYKNKSGIHREKRVHPLSDE